MSTHPNIPFYCGSQRIDWKCHNCEYCVKRYDEAQSTWQCDLEKLIDEAYMDDGSVSDITAKRMGQPHDCREYNWRCPEFVEDTAERARVKELTRQREIANCLRANRNRPAPWIEDWLASKKQIP
jgi:hypothetical protein